MQSTMADKTRLGEVRELKIGASFTNNKTTSFHTLKCDFKPASVDASKMATVDVGTNNQVTVTVPHLDGAGIPQTVFKGNQKPCQKDCVLIIDRVTGVMTLEKLSSNLQVKKTRQEPPHKPAPVSLPPPQSVAPRPHTPVDSASNCTQRSTSRTRVASGGRRGPSGAAQPPKTSPPRHRTSPPQATPWSFNAGQSTLASLPMIGLDEPAQPIIDIPHIPPPLTSVNGHVQESRSIPIAVHDTEDVGVLSSSSGSSSSGSDSEHSDSGGSSKETPYKSNMSNSKPTHNGGHNGSSAASADASMPMQLLNDDLCLSESGSDSD